MISKRLLLAMAVPCFAVAPHSIVAAATDVAVPDGLVSKPYDLVRPELIRRGFEPVTLKHDEKSDYYCDEGFCSRYPEVLNCAGTGLSPCQFVYIHPKAKKYLLVDTRGETRLTVTGSHWAHDYEMQDIRQRR